MQQIPCDVTSTISTGSFSTNETLNASPIDTGECSGFVVLVKGKLWFNFMAERVQLAERKFF